MSCPDDSTLQDFADGRLAGPQHAAIVAHVADCERCRRVVAALSSSGTPGPMPPPDSSAPSIDGSVPVVPGQRIGSYRVTGRIGKGGMGSVFAAVHERIERRVAIKVLDRAHARQPEHLTRFLNEARAASRVEHPGIVQIFEIGQIPDGPPYLVMEYLAGQSMQEALEAAGGRLEPPRALRLARQIALVLCAAHERGIVHRDLKPGNVMLLADPELPGGERAKVLDFGLAKLVDAGSGSQLTRSGMLMGTPLYMSPEQCRGARDVAARSDVYSLGVILYQALCGQPPFSGPETGKVLGQHMYEAPPPLRQRKGGLPAPLVDLVHEMLAKSPADCPSMASVVSRLEALGPSLLGLAAPDRPASHRWRSPGWRVLGAAGLLLALAAAGVWRSRSRLVAPPGAGARRGADVPAGAAPMGMVLVPGGTFSMGSPTQEIQESYRSCRRLLGANCRFYEREQPVRQVQISPFFLDLTEVTNAEFATWLNQLPGLQVVSERLVKDGEVLLADLERAHGGLDQRLVPTREGKPVARFQERQGSARMPVVQVTWDGARRYCEAQGKRLPTEAEWEFAARGPEGRPFPWGPQEPRCDGVTFGRGPGLACAGLGAKPSIVGSSPQDRTPLGVADLAGNVLEWVQDQFRETYELCESTCADPLFEGAGAEASGTLRAIRGGDWAEPAEASLATRRTKGLQGEAITDVGFRCARPAPR